MSRRPQRMKSFHQQLKDPIRREVVTVVTEEEVTVSVVVAAIRATAVEDCWQVEEPSPLSSEPSSASFLLSF